MAPQDFLARRQRPARRPAAERRSDFRETDSGLTASQAIAEARRCVQCAKPPCAVFGCPLTQRIPEWIGHIAEGRFREAWRVISLRNNLPECCGKLCPQETLCESRCVVGKVAEPVAIGKLEEFVARTARRQGWVEGDVHAPAAAPSGRRVAIFGTGPAGLAAAEELLARGHEVTLFDRRPRAGGLLRYGIPSFKFAKERLGAWLARLERRGARFRFGVEFGRDLDLAALREGAGPERHDAVLLAIGAEKGRALAIPGADLRNVFLAGDFLIAGNPGAEGVSPRPRRIEPGRVCVVFGGGDTAMDCVRTAVRLGFSRVVCVYRRGEAEMTGRGEDRERAVEEGVEFRFLEAPRRFLGQEGRGRWAECVKMRLGEPDASGRPRPEPVEGSLFTIPADCVVLALGYEVDPEAAARAGLRLAGGALETAPDHSTAIPGVFAAGDAVNGPDLIVTAVRSGREAARSIHAWLASRTGERGA